MVDGHKTQENLHPRGNGFFPPPLVFCLCVSVGIFCLCTFFSLGDITGYAMGISILLWASFSFGPGIELVCVPRQKGFCLTVTGSLVINSSSLLKACLFVEKRLRTR